MSEMRAYTVAEVDDLRAVVERKWLFGSYQVRDGASRSYQDHEKEAAVEQRVRTHMLAGHTAADLLASESNQHVAESPTNSDRVVRWR